jgi:hypothetical protein
MPCQLYINLFDRIPFDSVLFSLYLTERRITFESIRFAILIHAIEMEFVVTHDGQRRKHADASQIHGNCRLEVLCIQIYPCRESPTAVIVRAA